jgi:hypothetical protein
MWDHLASFLTTHTPAITLWVGAICTFGIYSVLYKENPYYRLAEHIFIGLAMGLFFFQNWRDTLKPKLWDPMLNEGQWWLALTLAGGAMFYFMYSKKHNWINRLIMFGFMGMGAGVAFQGFANLYFPMIRGSFKAVIPTSTHVINSAKPGLGINMSLNNLVFIIVLITVMAYFFFSIDHKKKSVKHTASLGRWFLMFAFGAMFGSTVMARMALFIGRLDFLTTEWGPIVPRWFWAVIGGCAVLVTVGFFLLRFEKAPATPPEE